MKIYEKSYTWDLSPHLYFLAPGQQPHDPLTQLLIINKTGNDRWILYSQMHSLLYAEPRKHKIWERKMSFGLLHHKTSSWGLRRWIEAQNGVGTRKGFAEEKLIFLEGVCKTKEFVSKKFCVTAWDITHVLFHLLQVYNSVDLSIFHRIVWPPLPYFRPFSSRKEIQYSLSSHSHSLCPQLGETTNFLPVSKDLLLWTFNISKIIQCMIFYNWLLSRFIYVVECFSILFLSCGIIFCCMNMQYFIYYSSDDGYSPQ